MPSLTATSLKELIAHAGYADIRSINSKAFGVVVPKTRVEAVVPTLLRVLSAYRPVQVSTRELRVQEFSVFAKNANMQRGVAAFSHGRGNEFNLQHAIHAYIADYGKPIDITFTASNGRVFRAPNIKRVDHVGAQNIFARNKADVLLVSDTGRTYPLSIKDENAGAWESADSYWGDKAKHFLLWALKKRKTTLVDNGDGGYSVTPAIAVAATAAEVRDVVFGADILGHGAVIVKRFAADSFKWDFDKDVLMITCKSVILTPADLQTEDTVYFQIRNDRSRNTASLHRGLRTLATMKKKLTSTDMVFSQSLRAQMGI
jgi:hypothetical protein